MKTRGSVVSLSFIFPPLPEDNNLKKKGILWLKEIRTVHGSRGFQNLAGRVVSGQEASKSRGSDRVRSGQEFSKSRGSGRVGSGRVGSGRVGSGRVGSRVFKISRVGSSHDPRDTGHFAGQAIMTRRLFWADPRVKPADLASGSAFFKLTAESHIDAVQAPCGSGPRVRQQNTNISASCLPRADAPIVCHYSVQNNHQAAPLATRTKAYSSVTRIP